MHRRVFNSRPEVTLTAPQYVLHTFRRALERVHVYHGEPVPRPHISVERTLEDVEELNRGGGEVHGDVIENRPSRWLSVAILTRRRPTHRPFLTVRPDRALARVLHHTRRQQLFNELTRAHVVALDQVFHLVVDAVHLCVRRTRRVQVVGVHPPSSPGGGHRERPDPTHGVTQYLPGLDLPDEPFVLRL